MPNGTLFGRPELQTVTINDFTPGIINGSRTAALYSPERPLGSAANAYRCYARDKVGLKPMPTYTTRTTLSNSVSNAGLVTIGDIRVVPGPAGNYLILNYTQYDSTTSITYNFGYYNDPSNTFTTPYTKIVASGAPTQSQWPNIVMNLFTQAGRTTVSALTLDPQSAASTWVLLPDPNSAASFATGTVSTAWFKSAAANGRMVLMGPPSGAFGLPLYDTFFTSDIQSDTNLTGGEFFSPDVLGPIGAWGSISTGEFFIIGVNGGSVIIYGDIQNPTSAIFTPGVTGTGGAIGPALPSPAGLIYTTDYDGVYVWNGGNTSQKISENIVDTLLTRAIPPTMPSTPVMGTAPKGLWMNWAFFPNNYVYDCITGGWWLCEDPLVASMQVFGNAIGTTAQYFYSSIGQSGVASGGAALAVPIVRWDRATSANSYRWISNPIPAPGSNMEIRAVEICASNPTSSPVTITITPTSPPSQLLFPGNQIPSQPIPFTIPAFTAGFRASKTLGYEDYNMCIQVDAVAPANVAAPVIHEITLGYMPQSSGVE